MTKIEAIRVADSKETLNTTWNEKMGMWQELINPQTRTTLKRRRIERAMIILGLDRDDVNYRVQCSDEFDEMSFRQAIYSLKV